MAEDEAVALAVLGVAVGAAPYRGGAFIGQHGSWNCNPLSGYKVIFVPFKDGRPSGEPIDVLTGFVDNDGRALGRPVGVAIDKAGALLVADDVGNAVWRVTPQRRRQPRRCHPQLGDCAALHRRLHACVCTTVWRRSAFARRFGRRLAQNPDELRKPSAFSGILDTQARSRALFTEAAKVIMHPRCVNCHPASDRPTQGDDMHPHSPSTARGIDGGGVPGNTCGACHSDRNLDIFPGQQTSFRSIPGHSRWHLAPEEMAWEGKSIGDICRQIKDPQRNGGAISNCCTSIWRMTIWSRGAGVRDQGAIRFPAHRRLLGELIRAWIDSGATCP